MPLIRRTFPLMTQHEPGSRDQETETQCFVFARWPVELETKVHPKVRNHGEGLLGAFSVIVKSSRTFA